MATSTAIADDRAGIYHFALYDELGRSLGVFTSHRRGWRIGDWLLARNGRRLQIVGVLPPRDDQQEELGVSEIWLVEPA